MHSNMPTDPEQPRRDSPAEPTREIDSRELLRGQTMIIIRHREEAYRLCVTHNGKRILRK